MNRCAIRVVRATSVRGQVIWIEQMFCTHSQHTIALAGYRTYVLLIAHVCCLPIDDITYTGHIVTTYQHANKLAHLVLI